MIFKIVYAVMLLTFLIGAVTDNEKLGRKLIGVAAAFAWVSLYALADYVGVF